MSPTATCNGQPDPSICATSTTQNRTQLCEDPTNRDACPVLCDSCTTITTITATTTTTTTTESVTSSTAVQIADDSSISGSQLSGGAIAGIVVAVVVVGFVIAAAFIYKSRKQGREIELANPAVQNPAFDSLDERTYDEIADAVTPSNAITPPPIYARVVTENEDHMKRYSPIDPADAQYDSAPSGPPKPSTELKPVKLHGQYGSSPERRHRSSQERRYESITREEIDSAPAPTAHYDLYARQGGLQAEATYTQMTGNQQQYGVFDAPEDDVEL